MCSVSAPDPVEAEKPNFVRNPFLDGLSGDAATADTLRRGRSSLVIPTDQGIGFEGRGGSAGRTGAGDPAGNSRRSGRGTGGGGRPGVSTPSGGFSNPLNRTIGGEGGIRTGGSRRQRPNRLGINIIT